MEGAGRYKINTEWLRKLIDANGGMRPFASKAGLNRQTVYNILNGEQPDYNTLCRIAESLNMSGARVASIFFAESSHDAKTNELSGYSTCDLCRELECREGITKYFVEPYENFNLPTVNGPAIIYVNID